MPARALRITRNPLCRWCRPSLTAVTGPPLPPPEPLPDVSTATPCLPASGGLTSSCPTCDRARLSVHSMRAHARRAQPGVIMVGEGLPCGCHNGATVFLTGASRAVRHRKCQACQQARHAGSTKAGTRDGPGSSATASSQTPRAADPRRTTGDCASSTAGMPSSLGTGTATVCDCPSPHDGPFATEYLPLLYGRPLRYSPVIVAAYNQNRITSCFVMNIGCTSRGPTIHVVCGDLFFLLLLCFCVAVGAAPSCVCVPSVRGADTTDLSRRMYMRWSLVCRSCLLLPLPSVCWCCGRAVCVCACCRGLECVSCVVCGVRCMPGCCPLLMWCALCVCLPHLSSPLLLSMSLTVQISSTPLNDHTHDDDDVPSAVRPVGARPVLLPVLVRGRHSVSSCRFFPDDHGDHTPGISPRGEVQTQI
ncbi:hypothetical protein ECC02_013186 [Trypanosoma cruzi]|uniref:Mucin TcMUC n=1 Tax=Trypanosoma cruzi TaxID=5693 RepID=A0A7J6XI94_TRYCR|nr:hypothetical protein ECC02_013186 [Trypanosoma cruzi]